MTRGVPTNYSMSVFSDVPTSLAMSDMDWLTNFDFFLFLNMAPSTTVSSPAFTRNAPPKMAVFDSVVDVATSTVAQNSQMIATSVGDFGGYLFPVVGIGSLAVLILALAPPLADE